MKLVKIVYDYSIEKDCVQARQFFEPCTVGEVADIETPNGEDKYASTEEYTRKEWQDMLYKLGAHRPNVVIRKAMEELMAV